MLAPVCGLISYNPNITSQIHSVMCRWFSYISPAEPALLEDVLVTPENAISKQCAQHYIPGLISPSQSTDPEEYLRTRNSLLNMDGMGIAWYTATSSAYIDDQEGTRPALYKTQSPPTNDFNFRSLCANTESACIFAHIRATSGSPVTPINNHPFVFGRHSFMHNGTVTDFARIRGDMTNLMAYDAYINIRGTTDTEYVAALYMTFLTAYGSEASWQEEYPLQVMKAALVRTVTCIMELQRKSLGRKATPNGLNLCATDGRKFVACRFRNHVSEQPASLYWSDSAGTTLNRKVPGDVGGDRGNLYGPSRIGRHVIVSSEPTTKVDREWTLIAKNHMVMVDHKGVAHHEPLVYDAGLNAADVDVVV